MGVAPVNISEMLVVCDGQKARALDMSHINPGRSRFATENEKFSLLREISQREEDN